jgi:hypothetical protein
MKKLYTILSATALPVLAAGVVIITHDPKPVSTNLSNVGKKTPASQVENTTNGPPETDPEAPTTPTTASAVPAQTIANTPTPDDNRTVIKTLIDQEATSRGYTDLALYAQFACVDRLISNGRNPVGYDNYDGLVNDPKSIVNMFLHPSHKDDGDWWIYFDGAGECRIMFYQKS